MIHPTPVYLANSIKDWENRWFADGNGSYGLMQQAALMMANQLLLTLPPSRICLWCGSGNNGGDGYLLAVYLSRYHTVTIYQIAPPDTADAVRAYQAAIDAGIGITDAPILADVHIDAVFGSGLDRPLSDAMLDIVHTYNAQLGHKIAIDIPTGLHPDTGMPLPVCMSADMTLCLIGHKAGLLMGHAKSHVGQLICLPLIPADNALSVCAWIDNTLPTLTTRDHKHNHQHKGNYGSVLVIGGHPTMGGAVIMSAETAISVGAGRVTVASHQHNHSAIITRKPNLMTADIKNPKSVKIHQMSAVCIGMGLGRDNWSVHTYREWMRVLSDFLDGHHSSSSDPVADLTTAVVIDADALWHLATYHHAKLSDRCICTPHHAEAARLLGISADDVEADRIGAIQALQARYGGQWVLKGANTLTIDQHGTIRICTLGNAGMATAGMGDVLSGMMAGILAQAPNTPIHQIVALHAHCGDLLSADGIVVDVNQMGKIATKVLKTITPSDARS